MPCGEVCSPNCRNYDSNGAEFIRGISLVGNSRTKENPVAPAHGDGGSGPPCMERPQGAAGATRPVSSSSPERCDFTHPLGDLIQVSQERVHVRFVLTKKLELKAICDLDHAIKVTSHLLVESEVGAALCVAHDQDCRGGDAADSFDVINSDTEMIEGLGPRREYRVVPCFLPSCNRHHETSDGHQKASDGDVENGAVNHGECSKPGDGRKGWRGSGTIACV